MERTPDLQADSLGKRRNVREGLLVRVSLHADGKRERDAEEISGGSRRARKAKLRRVEKAALTIRKSVDATREQSGR